MSYSYFDHNRNLQIHGDVTFVTSGGSTQDDRSIFQVSQRVQATNAQSRAFDRGFKLLCDNTAPSARYGYGHSFMGPQCHPGTRTAVQDHILKWLDDDDSQIAMWMNGPVGIGKSAIAQTVAHLAAEHGQLSSAFFFFRSDDTRNSAKCLVPTLAYEMTQRMPHTLDHVCQTIGVNPLMFSSPLEHQIISTLLRPLCSPFESSPRGCKLIIIDGLDECLDTSTQQAIIRSFVTSLLSMATDMIPHKILIVSRPESHITSAFAATDIFPHVKYLALDPWDTEDDIGTFLRAKLDEIKQTHPLKHYLPDVWPEEESLRRLRESSVGSFAYASAALRFLASHTANPESVLQDLLSLRPTRAAAAFADLDALYRHIFLSLDAETRFTLQKVLCLFLYCSRSYRKIHNLAARLSTEKSVVEIALIRVSSLIQIYNSTNDSSQSIKFYHSSFEEFLQDRDRSRDFYAFTPDVARAVAAALSSIWLDPIHDLSTYDLFDHMGRSIRNTDTNELDIQILATLVETNIPATFLSVKLNRLYYASTLVAAFFEAIHLRSVQDSDSTYGPLYNQAYTVVCAWMRSQLDHFFQSAPTSMDIENVIQEDSRNTNTIVSTKYLSLDIFCRLAKQQRGSFDSMRRVFPEMERLEIKSGILERYLALPPAKRKADIAKCDPTHGRISQTELYLITFGPSSVEVPSFCQRLEQMVLAGQKALGPVPDIYVTPGDCIFRFFYGEGCYIDSQRQLAVGNEKVSDILEKWYPGRLVLTCSHLAECTDQYIRRTHTKLDFAYISEDIEALYRPRELATSF